MKRTIKVLMFTFYEEVDSNSVPGQKVLIERLGRLGEEVDIPRAADIERGERLGAFYTDEELDLIAKGKYTGPDAVLVRQRLQEAQIIQPLDDEGAGTKGTLTAEELADMSDEQIARHIIDNKLTVNETLELAGDRDVALMEKVLDAETLVASEKEVDVRTGVKAGLEARMSKATSGASA